MFASRKRNAECSLEILNHLMKQTILQLCSVFLHIIIIYLKRSLDFKVKRSRNTQSRMTRIIYQAIIDTGDNLSARVHSSENRRKLCCLDLMLNTPECTVCRLAVKKIIFSILNQIIKLQGCLCQRCSLSYV